jgi:hypothetical protein
MTPETLRQRLKRLAGFTDDDFTEAPQGHAVEIGYDHTGTIVLIGKTGALCRATLAFPIGFNISFTGEGEGMMPGMDMTIADQGRRAGGDPVLILEMAQMPGIGQRDWEMAYFCSNVDMTVIY